MSDYGYHWDERNKTNTKPAFLTLGDTSIVYNWDLTRRTKNPLPAPTMSLEWNNKQW